MTYMEKKVLIPVNMNFQKHTAKNIAYQWDDGIVWKYACQEVKIEMLLKEEIVRNVHPLIT